MNFKSQIQRRKMLITFIVAGMGAVLAEHLFKPGFSRRLKV